MTAIHYRQDALYIEDLPATELAAQFGTPLYVYSKSTLLAAYQAYADALAGTDHLLCYAMKANSNLSLLKLLAERGAGFDIVSGGELQRALAVGADPAKIVFSGVGKTEAEMALALHHGIHCFNVESVPELHRLNDVAGREGKIAPISLRVNPDVDAKTHPYISTGLKDNKFGIAYREAREAYRTAAALPNLNVLGIDCHIGSQLTEVQPFADALDRLLILIDQLAEDGIHLEHLDMGGGVGICYNDEQPPAVADYAQVLLNRLAGRKLKLVLEPGRALVGNAGVLLTTVQFLKEGESKHFAIVDGAMNDLIRPALYEGWHRALPAVRHSDLPDVTYDVVGPVCESADFLAQDRPLAVKQGDVVALLSAGAYGMSMSSNYNTRARAAEVLVDGSEVKLIRRRETIEEMLAAERDCL